MKNLVLALSVLIAALSAPAAAQPVVIPGATAVPAPATQPPVPESGTADYRLELQSGRCVFPIWTMPPGQDPILRTNACSEAITFNAVFWGGSRASFEVDRTGKCITSPPASGIYARDIRVTPCNRGLEQRYRVEVARTPGYVRLRGVTGQCLNVVNPTSQIANDPMMYENDCVDSPGQLFKLVRVYPAGYIPPAGNTALPVAHPVNPGPVATPVTPDPLPAAPEPRSRPEGLPESAPIPGIYQTAGGPGLNCLVPVRRGENFVLRGGACNESPWENLLLEYQGDGFVIYVPSIDRKCLTLPGGGWPWTEMEACDTPSAQQKFAVEQSERGGYRIKTGAGLCLTLRGNPGATPNNSALFPEPCRADDSTQLFELRLMIDKRDL